jgi:hypothetical protein
MVAVVRSCSGDTMVHGLPSPSHETEVDVASKAPTITLTLCPCYVALAAVVRGRQEIGYGATHPSPVQRQSVKQAPRGTHTYRPNASFPLHPAPSESRRMEKLKTVLLRLAASHNSSGKVLCEAGGCCHHLSFRLTKQQRQQQRARCLSSVPRGRESDHASYCIIIPQPSARERMRSTPVHRQDRPRTNERAAPLPRGDWSAVLANGACVEFP